MLAAFAPCQCLSLSPSHVSSPPLVKPDVRFSRIRLSDGVMLSSACSMVWLSRSSSDLARRLSVVVPCGRSILPPPYGPFPPPALPGFSGTTGLSATLPAQPVPRGLSVDVSLATDRASHVAALFLFPACQRHYPGGPKGVPMSLASPPASAFPVSQAGRLPHCLFRGLLNVHSRSGPQVR